MKASLAANDHIPNAQVCPRGCFPSALVRLKSHAMSTEASAQLLHHGPVFTRDTPNTLTSCFASKRVAHPRTEARPMVKSSILVEATMPCRGKPLMILLPRTRERFGLSSSQLLPCTSCAAFTGGASDVLQSSADAITSAVACERRARRPGSEEVRVNGPCHRWVSYEDETRVHIRTETQVETW